MKPIITSELVADLELLFATFHFETNTLEVMIPCTEHTAKFHDYIHRNKFETKIGCDSPVIDYDKIEYLWFDVNTSVRHFFVLSLNEGHENLFEFFNSIGFPSASNVTENEVPF